MDESLRQLIIQAGKGDKTAFAALVQRFQNRIFSIAYGIIGNRQDAEDIAQETFIKAYKGIAKLNNAEGFYNWLLRITVNTSINCKKSLAQARYIPLEEVAEPVYQGISPEEYIARQENIKLLGSVLVELTPDHRAILVLREIENLSYDEIANLLGIPLGTVKSRMNHAREKLRQSLSKR